MPRSLFIQRYIASKVLKLAILEMFPKAQLAGGDASELGFHCQFSLASPLGPEVLPLIEEKMRFLIKEKIPFKPMEMMRKNASDFLRHHKQPLLAVFALAENSQLVGLINMGALFDLSSLSVSGDSSEAGAVKLLDLTKQAIDLPSGGVAEVYRIEGTACEDQQALKSFLKVLASGAKRDHRILGQEMGLFKALDVQSPHFWLPKGEMLWETLHRLWWQERKALRFKKVATPFFDDPAASFGLYRLAWEEMGSFPLRLAEWKPKVKKGKDEENAGLFLAKTYLAEEAWIFCPKHEVLQELISSLQFINKMIKIFGFELHWYLIAKSVKKEGALDWDKSLDYLKRALEAASISYTLDKEGRSRLGPKAEGRIEDAYGRKWGVSSVMIDCFHPAKADLLHKRSGEKPFMISTSVYGSKERFIALLIEHYAGQLPLWLAPEQVRVIPVGDSDVEYAREIKAKMEERGLRADLDSRQKQLGVKIHSAEIERIPYAVIVGEKERRLGRVTLRLKGKENPIEIGSLLEQLQAEQNEEKVVLLESQ